MAGTLRLFVVALFFTLVAHVPQTAQSRPGFPSRMAVMHSQWQVGMTLLDPAQSPTVGGATVGRYLGTQTVPNSPLLGGDAYPSTAAAAFIYGYSEGATIVRMSGFDADEVIPFTDTFARFGGATRVTRNVALAPRNTVCSSEGLAEHYAIVGEANQANPALTGTASALMLIDPATMTPHRIGTGTLFLSSGEMYLEDVCYVTYPGPDGNYATRDDNESRYVMAYQTQADLGGLAILSLNAAESTDPASGAPGPDYPSANPQMNANPRFATTTHAAVYNGQSYCRSYHLPAGIPGCSATGDRDYVIEGWVEQTLNIPPVWTARVAAVDLGAAWNAASSVASRNVGLWNTTDIFKSMAIVGNWIFATTGASPDGSGSGSRIDMFFAPEFIDGSSDGDDGYRGFWAPGAANTGFVAPLLDSGYRVQTTYFGTGFSTSTLYATNSDAYVDHQPNIATDNGGLTVIDCHTDEERALGLNIRRAPQPFVGFTPGSLPTGPVIRTTYLPDATQGVPYSRRLQYLYGSNMPTWTIAAGQLPAGLTLDPTSGLISGTPTTLGTATFTVNLTAGGTDVVDLEINVVAPVVPVVPVVPTQPAPHTVEEKKKSACSAGTQSNFLPLVIALLGLAAFRRFQR